MTASAQPLLRLKEFAHTCGGGITCHNAEGRTCLDIVAIFWFHVVLMTISLVKSVPQGDFAEISALANDWQAKFQTLVGQNRSIKFDIYPILKMPPEIRACLDQRGYRDLVLEKDQWQHFLIPNSN